MLSGEVYRELGEAAWGWVLAQARDDDGPWFPEVVGDGVRQEQPGVGRDGLYAGIGGLSLLLAEIAQARQLTAAEESLATGIVERLAAQATSRVEPSLYDGLAGDAAALRLLAPGREQATLQRLADLRADGGWNTTLGVVKDSNAPLPDVVMGTAGIVMTAIWAGGEFGDALAARGAEVLLSVAEQTPAGLDWRTWPGSSSPNFSHGTAGAGAALALTGRALGRDDFIAAAVDGARHVISVAWTDGGRFVVPHTIPESSREVEPVTYSWCHGPAGTSLLFAALAHAGVSEVDGHDVAELRRRCLRTVLGAGVPQRLRPGFWDNDGRCCGTAGVGDVFLDAAQDAIEPDLSEEWLQAAVVMADALVERAVRDESGARWQFVEYRNAQPLLEPNTTWMQGAAGIGAFLFRVARVLDDGMGAAVVDRPDQWWAVPRGLRVSVQAATG